MGISEHDNGKSRPVHFWYSVEDRFVFDEQMGRRRKRRTKTQACDRRWFVSFFFWQWRHTSKSQSVGHKRALSP